MFAQLLPAVLAGLLAFQGTQAPQPLSKPVSTDEQPVEWVCPMDRDVRLKSPGKCPRCGMTLVPGIPDFAEYKTLIRTTPKAIRPGAPVDMTFEMVDPTAHNKRITEFGIVHEKFVHLFLVSQDLKFFAHEHPVLQPSGEFKFQWKFPQPGMYRVLTDYYPKGGNPQLNTNTLFVEGAGPQQVPVKLTADVTPQKGENLTASLTLDPPQPIAGFKTLMFIELNPGDGLEKYIGAWAHMLAASEDLVDLIHNHPFIADGSPKMQFNMIFPRPGVYRVWIQFQRNGVVNTVAFNVPVEELK